MKKEKWILVGSILVLLSIVLLRAVQISKVTNDALIFGIFRAIQNIGFAGIIFGLLKILKDKKPEIKSIIGLISTIGFLLFAIEQIVFTILQIDPFLIAIIQIVTIIIANITLILITIDLTKIKIFNNRNTIIYSIYLYIFGITKILSSLFPIENVIGSLSGFVMYIDTIIIAIAFLVFIKEKKKKQNDKPLKSLV